MKKSDLLNIIPIEKAIELINNNITIRHQWYVVINNKGCIFEIHGTSTDTDIEIVLPEYDEYGDVKFTFLIIRK